MTTRFFLKNFFTRNYDVRMVSIITENITMNAILNVFQSNMLSWFIWILFYSFIYTWIFGNYFEKINYNMNQSNKAAYYQRFSVFISGILFGVFYYDNFDNTPINIRNTIGLSTIINELFSVSFINKDTKKVWIIHASAVIICNSVVTFFDGFIICVKTFVVMEFGSEFFLLRWNSNYIKNNITLNISCMTIYTFSRLYSLRNLFILIHYKYNNYWNYLDLCLIIPWFMALILNGYFIYNALLKLKVQINAQT